MERQLLSMFSLTYDWFNVFPLNSIGIAASKIFARNKYLKKKTANISHSTWIMNAVNTYFRFFNARLNNKRQTLIFRIRCICQYLAQTFDCLIWIRWYETISTNLLKIFDFNRHLTAFGSERIVLDERITQTVCLQMFTLWAKLNCQMCDSEIYCQFCFERCVKHK